MPKFLATSLFILLFAFSGFSQKIVIEHSDKTPKPSMLEEGKFKVFLVNDSGAAIHLFYSHHKEYGGTETTSEKSLNGKVLKTTNKWKPMDTNSKYDSRAIVTIPMGAKKHISTMLIDEKQAGKYVLKYRINQDPTTVNKSYAQNGAAVAAVSRITLMDIEGTFEYTVEQLEKKPFVARDITYEELKKEKNQSFVQAEYDPSSVFAMKVILNNAAEATETFAKLGQLKNVRKLSINVSSDEDIVVPASIGELPLMELHLRSSKKKAGKLVLPTDFLKSGDLRNVSLSELKDLDLSFLANHTKIEKLSMNSCADANPTWLGSLVNLTDLSISGSKMTDLPEGFKNLTKLKKLDIFRNQLTSLENFPIALELKSINAEDNQLTALPDAIGQLSGLTYLNCKKNKITSLPKDLSGLTSLTKINLFQNEITELPASITSIKTLTNLYLNNNKLSSLPEGMGGLTALKTLNLAENNFTKFPKGLSSLPSLSELNINKNKISQLGTDLTKMRQLRTFKFEDNKITTLPEGFYSMKLYRIYSKNNPLDKKTVKSMKKTFGRKVKS